jgi:hypothetical protein
MSSSEVREYANSLRSTLSSFEVGTWNKKLTCSFASVVVNKQNE